MQIPVTIDENREAGSAFYRHGSWGMQQPAAAPPHPALRALAGMQYSASHEASRLTEPFYRLQKTW